MPNSNARSPPPFSSLSLCPITLAEWGKPLRLLFLYNACDYLGTPSRTYCLPR